MRQALIDTNVYVAFKTNHPRIVNAFQNLDVIGMDVTVIGELLAGFILGTQERHNRLELQEFLNNSRVLLIPHDLNTAEYYAAVFKTLRLKGKPIPSNDIWIAASAMRHGLPLFTLDKHFVEIDGLLLKSDY